MTAASPRVRRWRDVAGAAASLAGLATGATLLVGAVLGGWAGSAQRYFAAGYYRLLAGEISARFDAWVGPAVVITLGGAALVRSLGRRPVTGPQSREPDPGANRGDAGRLVELAESAELAGSPEAGKSEESGNFGMPESPKAANSDKSDESDKPGKPGQWCRWAVFTRLGGLGVPVLVLVLILRAALALDRYRLADGPNVVLISIDTLRADRLGSYGHARPTSPTIDRRLAAAGVVFERCLSQSPKTTPSHMTMLTSLYPCVHGVSLWNETGPGPVLSPAVHTLAEVLKNAGYVTGAFTGRGHVHRSRGFGQGFDVYRHRRRYGRERDVGRPRELDQALEWMDANRRRRFFLFFHTYAVHDPYLPPPETLGIFDDGTYRGPLRQVLSELRGGAQQWDDAHRVFWEAADTSDPGAVRFLERLYDGAIRHADEWVVGVLLDRLETLALAGRTLVVLTSDHGEAFGEHGRFLHGDLYVETLHVPLILRFPGRLPAGARVRAPVRLLDVMPTVLELVGLPAPPGIQGRSLVPLITAGEPRAVGAVTSEFNDGRTEGSFESIRRGGLTYIVDGRREQIFDHESDPEERRDLAPARGAELAALRKELALWQQECRELRAELGPGTETVAPDRATVDQLRALGYVE